MCRFWGGSTYKIAVLVDQFEPNQLHHLERWLTFVWNAGRLHTPAPARQPRASQGHNLDDVMVHIDTDYVAEWLVRANESVTEMQQWWCHDDNGVKFSHFWLSVFPDDRRKGCVRISQRTHHRPGRGQEREGWGVGFRLKICAAPRPSAAVSILPDQLTINAFPEKCRGCLI